MTVVMAGTAPRGRGGIASAARQYLEAGTIPGVRVRYLITHVEQGIMGSFWAYLRALLTLTGLLILRRADLVHVHMASRGSFVRKSVLLVLARLFRVPSVLHLHGGGFDAYFNSRPWSIQKRWIQWVFTGCSRVLVLSETWRSIILGMAPGSRIEVLPNAVAIPDVELRVPPADAPDTRAKTRKAVVLFVGRLDARKGILDLIAAMPEVLRQFPGTVLEIAGDGDRSAVEQAVLDAGLDGSVIRLGWLDPPTLAAHFRACTLFALPSYAEGLPMTLLEAMMHAKPIVVSPVGGIRDTVRDRDSALFVAPGNVGQISSAIITILADPAFAERLGLRARRDAESRFGLAAHMNQLGRVYAELARNRNVINPH